MGPAIVEVYDEWLLVLALVFALPNELNEIVLLVGFLLLFPCPEAMTTADGCNHRDAVLVLESVLDGNVLVRCRPSFLLISLCSKDGLIDPEEVLGA